MSPSTAPSGAPTMAPQPVEPPGRPSGAGVAAVRRQHRASVARRLLDEVPHLAASLDWVALGQAPAWMALPPTARAQLIRRVGSVLLAPALRLWIAAGPIAAARRALGEAWWDALVQHRGWPALPPQAPSAPGHLPLDGSGVEGLLHEAGAAVLLATLPHGALRHLASQWLAPVGSLLMPPAVARQVLAQALALSAPHGAAESPEATA